MTALIAIRVDGSAQIGTGHVQRCLSLAEALRKAGADVIFVTRLGGDVIPSLISAREFTHYQLPTERQYIASENDPAHAHWAQVDWQTDAADTLAAFVAQKPDWVIIDHYAFDARWHDYIREQADCRIAVIDDLGDRKLSADLLIDHNPTADPKSKYHLSNATVHRSLIGSRYGLLGPDYAALPKRIVSPNVDSIGIFMGGADADNLSCKMLKAARNAGFTGKIEIISTSANPNLAELESAVEADPNCTLKLDQPSLSAFFASHDLHIGAAGGATWERSCAGAPSVVFQSADNQGVVIDALLAANAAICCRSVELDEVTAAIKQALSDWSLRQSLSDAASLLADGQGCVRVAVVMLSPYLTVRPANIADGNMVHQWRNDPRTRSVSRDPQEIPLESHLLWFKTSLNNPARHIWIGMIGESATGLVRFDQIDTAKFEVSIFLNPNLHGLGLGSPLLRAGEDALAATQLPPVEIHAETLSENTGSQAMFLREGYEGALHFVKTLPSKGED
jgi:UDP-2,4-diacetamido-2,4,6-trideoxy-beta-L-altropyranose hydrolase